MAWYLTQSVYPISDDPGNNRRLYRTDVYLNASGYNAYAEGWAANGGGYVDGQPFSWTGPSSASLNNSSVVIKTSDHWIYGDANGWHGDVGASAWFDGGGGYAPGYISTSAVTGGFDYDRKPDAPSSVTPTLNADKSITVTSNVVNSPAGTATYYVAYSSNGGSTWSSDVTISGNARSYTFAAGTLEFGKTYKFRMKASNTDGTSAYTSTTLDTFLPIGGRKYDGTTWPAMATAKKHDGTNWNTFTIAKRHDGTNWVNLS